MRTYWLKHPKLGMAATLSEERNYRAAGYEMISRDKARRLMRRLKRLPVATKRGVLPA